MCPKISTLHIVADNFKWNTFPFWSIFQISLDFKLNWRFCSKFESPENCSLRLIATTIAYPSELNFGQEVIHGDLQFLHYDLVDIYKLTPKIQEVMKFLRWLIVKLILEKNYRVWKLGCIALIGAMKQILSELNFFFRFPHLYNSLWGTLSLLEVWSQSIPINSEKILTKLNGPHYTELENFEF
jgi:hypothetical protein